MEEIETEQDGWMQGEKRNSCYDINKPSSQGQEPMVTTITTNQSTSTHMYDGATNTPGEQLMYKDPILLRLHVYAWIPS